MRRPSLIHSLLVGLILLNCMLLYYQYKKQKKTIEKFESTSKYISAFLVGGFANRVFQLLAVKRFAEEKGHIPCIDLKSMGDNPHESKELTLKGIQELFPDFQIVSKDIKWNFIEEDSKKEFTFQEELFRNLDTTKDMQLKGYFQNPNYFPRELPSFQQPRKNAFFIHIRLGDYVNSRHDVGLKEYYKRAFDLFAKKSPIQKAIVFSNEPEKAKDFLEELEIPFSYTISNAKEALDVVKEMAACTGGICANSSLSYIGAALQPSPKSIVTMPNLWIKDVSKENFKTFYPSWATVLPVNN